MAYIFIFSIFLPSLNNNTIFIFSSYFIKRTLASFFKFSCICATESLPGIYKPPELSQIISHRPGSTLTTPLQDWSPPPLLLLLDVPCTVDRCCSCTALLVSTKRTAALPWRGSDHCSRTCPLTHRQCHRNILVAILIYIATFSLPKSFDYLGRAIQVHSQERAIQVHSQERAIQVHSKLVPQASSLLTSSHSGQACHCGAVNRLWRSFPARVSLILPTCYTSCYCWTPTVGWVCSWRYALALP